MKSRVMSSAADSCWQIDGKLMVGIGVSSILRAQQRDGTHSMINNMAARTAVAVI